MSEFQTLESLQLALKLEQEKNKKLESALELEKLNSMKLQVTLTQVVQSNGGDSSSSLDDGESEGDIGKLRLEKENEELRAQLNVATEQLAISDAVESTQHSGRSSFSESVASECTRDTGTSERVETRSEVSGISNLANCSASGFESDPESTTSGSATNHRSKSSRLSKSRSNLWPQVPQTIGGNLPTIIGSDSIEELDDNTFNS